MSNLNSQQINAFYERYKTSFVTFSKDAIKATGLCTNKIYLKCMGELWPCAVYSVSLESARILANTRTGLMDTLNAAHNTASLRFAFKPHGNTEEIVFFVNMKSMGMSPYHAASDIALFSFHFIQRPSDDLIDILGRFLSVHENFTKRRAERIELTGESVRKLNVARKGEVAIKNAARNCIIQDLSFFGVKIMVKEEPQSLEVEQAVLSIHFNNPSESFMVPGRVARVEPVKDRQGLIALGISFHEEAIPINFKLRISDYLNRVHQDHTRHLTLPFKMEAS
jgi:Tfp pilus assembly protein PilZ